MTHRMIFNQTSYFGRGAISNLVPELRSRNLNKVLLITDAILLETGVTAKITDLLDDAGFPYEIFSDVRPNPPVENVKAAVEVFRECGADALIGLGGGSPQDTAKAVGIIAANPEFADVISLEGVADTKNPSVPIIGIPTTAGTASETTINYVITDTDNQRKFVCVDPHDIPVLAIVDPDLTDSMPRGLKAATGLDALTHAIEGYITKGAWELSDSVHMTAIRMAAENLEKSLEGDAEAGEKMAYASYIAGMGYSNVGLGLVHGMAHPLGGRYGAPHGVANGILLAPVMRYNAEYSGEKYRDIADAFGVKGAYDMPLEEARKAACDAVADLTVRVGNPTKVSEVGVDESGLDALADDAFADVCTPGNPREATRDEIREIYASLL
ncbi:lactaldehyde reductase [Corynebacterium sp. CCM 8835]|uniref:Lactaldehyde reductase n=1 Tax=Corynebacterium antarcticum TaxID=2800405 RepID=A0ABS1FHZ0_9CORY|nr:MULTISPECIES: lactaldehyde reductase [Corynebacterium]MBV7292597.1 lactaldehyde reductase [Corynebacterium sp. TAE3-ERU16]MCK7642244.1 lactaldehyde reductase [Corynebacterium antarcticum]MCK7661071.1 lactaldehyde reductase [Corynebacterium antarcticum]MCL0245819.1 lactaldehyde reductase [Corynebacterium antarcticum]MCX7491724.1 lactaldehyde reductase [Corynebacterium antarcticum]